MRARSLVLAFLWAGLLLVASSQPLAAAVIETSTTKTGAPASKAEWDKLVTDAKKEGTVVISAGPIGEARVALINAFRQKYGISLEIVLSRGEEALAKMETERRAGIYAIDAVMQGMTTYFNSSMLKAATIPIAPLLVLPEVLDLSKWRGAKLPLADKQGHMAVLVLASTPHLLINTKLVKPGEITSHQDLLNPKWKGKLVMNDPSLAGAGTEWFTFIVTKAMGIEKGTAFMKQLAKQEPVVTRDQRLLSEWVARGKYAAALAPNKTTTVQLMRTGVPLAYADLKEPRPTSAGSGVITIADRAPHPNATKLFVNWLLSREGAAVFAKSYGYPATRLDVPAEGVDPIFIPKRDEVVLGEDYQLSKGAMLKLAGEIFKDLIK